MSDTQTPRSILEIMNDILKTVRDYYDSEYVYYVEYDELEILTIYEWCAENVPWNRDKLKMLEPVQMPKWLKEDITDINADSYSISQPLSEGVTGRLSVVNVRRGGCTLALMQAVLPYISQAIVTYKMQKQQEYLSYHDDLTGLLNRNSFVAYLNNVKEKKLKSAGTLSADINGLKNFNSEFGREYGDEVVIRVGEVLEEYFRGADVYRMTGDEYLVVSENISYEEFMKKVRLVHQKLDLISLGLVSVGYAWEKIEIDMDSMIRDAEDMMREEKRKYYKLKQKGRHEPIIKEDLLTDIDNGNFIVCLIPIVDVQYEQVTAAEAVVRYQHKDLGIIHPARYVSLLEETKLSHYLDLYVFEEICRTLHRWDEEGIPMMPVSVKFSGATLQKEDIADKMLELVEKYGVPCEYLEVEVAESIHDMNQEMLAETSNKVRKANIRVTLDHFGSKESSFSILSAMEFDGLKLDKGMISNLLGSSKTQMISEAVIEICHRLGVTVIATGIETRDQLNMLKELGCDYAQGALFNKPVTIDTFELRYLREVH